MQIKRVIKGAVTLTFSFTVAGGLLWVCTYIIAWMNSYGHVDLVDALISLGATMVATIVFVGALASAYIGFDRVVHGKFFPWE